MTMDTGVEIDHVKLKDASARRNYDEKFFHFWPKSFHFPGLVTQNEALIPSRKMVMHGPPGPWGVCKT